MSPTLPSTLPKSYTLKSNNNLTQQCSVFVGLVISGVLDIPKLHTAHKELVELWPALGGKLITSTTPYSFTTGSTVDFKARSLTWKVSEIGLTPYEQTSLEPSFYTVNSKSDELFHYDTLSSNPPPPTLFTLRVTVLEDATLLGFRFPHHLFDGQACYDTVHAYTLLLSSLPIPQLIPAPDITALLSDRITGEDNLPPSVHTHPHVDPRSNYVLGLWGFVIYLFVVFFHVLLVKLGFEDEDEQKMVHIPRSFIENLRAECQEELNKAVLDGEVHEGKGLELTKNDVITAWIMKGAYAAHNPSPNQGLDIFLPFNYRRFIAPLPTNQTYLHNSFYNIRSTFPSLAHFQSLPLWQVAHEIRLTCVRNMQPSAVKSTLRFLEDNAKTFISPYPPDRPLSIYYGAITSYWTRFEYHCLDFSAALDKEKGGNDPGKGQVLFTQAMPVYPFGLTIKPNALVCKDGRGGYWARVWLLKSWWRGFGECGAQRSVSQ